MQITITVEELTDYQHRCKVWSDHAAHAKSEILKNHMDPHRYSNIADFMAEGTRRLDQWEKENPFPLILPKV